MSKHDVVVFGTSTALDPAMWQTFGVSVKETDSPIGEFGTGLKYAIAVLLRHGRSITIEVGDHVYEFETKSKLFRSAEFDIVLCNDEEMPFTTRLGYKWELWQAYRELESNCIDEGGNVGERGITRIYTELGDIDHSDVFRPAGTLLFSNRYANVFVGESQYLYCKGVRVLELETLSKYTYDLKDADLTEDRTLKRPVFFAQVLWKSLCRTDNKKYVEDVLLKSKGYYESTQQFGFACLDKPSDLLVNVCKEHYKKTYWRYNNLLEQVKEHFPATADEFTEFTDLHVKALEKAKTFLEHIGYPITYELKLCTTLGEDVLARADRTNEVILLSPRVMSQGVKQIAATLLEEQLHIQYHFDDLTYAFQTFLFDQIITLGEQVTGDPL